MQKNLKNNYIFIIVPVITLFIVFGVIKEFNLVNIKLPLPVFIYPLIFILSATTSIAGPIFLRTYFANSMRNSKSVERDIFFRFEKRLLFLSLITPYLALISIVFEFPKFYSGFIVMFSLYAVYYYFPSKKRIDFDKKIFRVK
ncbi:MAG: hypothetical protein GY714_27900 [Desulfobacterales bacterium]|nr:hypothetical protein [Desulfobacterales bacterium]MCP4159325.1 hypothetical protein [Deltaproteobacteria bacterium]